MDTRRFNVAIFLISVLILSIGCIPQPERTPKVYTSKQYTEFTEFKEFESGLYNERYGGKDYKMKLFYNSVVVPNVASILQVKDKIIVIAKKDDPEKPYIIHLSKDYRDLIISMKRGDPITVYGTMRGKHLECDKLVKGHE